MGENSNSKKKVISPKLVAGLVAIAVTTPHVVWWVSDYVDNAKATKYFTTEFEGFGGEGYDDINMNLTWLTQSFVNSYHITLDLDTGIYWCTPREKGHEEFKDGLISDDHTSYELKDGMKTDTVVDESIKLNQWMQEFVRAVEFIQTAKPVKVEYEKDISSSYDTNLVLTYELEDFKFDAYFTTGDYHRLSIGNLKQIEVTTGTKHNFLINDLNSELFNNISFANIDRAVFLELSKEYTDIRDGTRFYTSQKAYNVLLSENERLLRDVVSSKSEKGQNLVAVHRATIYDNTDYTYYIEALSKGGSKVLTKTYWDGTAYVTKSVDLDNSYGITTAFREPTKAEAKDISVLYGEAEYETPDTEQRVSITFQDIDEYSNSREYEHLYLGLDNENLVKFVSIADIENGTALRYRFYTLKEFTGTDAVSDYLSEAELMQFNKTLNAANQNIIDVDF